MRLSDILARLDVTELQALAFRIVPGAQDLAVGGLAHSLENFLCRTGWVEQTISARRPPVISLLVRLVDAAQHVIEIDGVRAEVAAEVDGWCRQVTAGELANRIPERSRIYRRLLDAAWSNDSALDPSEMRLLRLLGDEFGLFRIEHFLLAHHASIQPYWRNESSLDVVIQQLLDHGVIYWAEPGKIALPDEFVRHVRRAIGISMSNDAARRLLQRLDSGIHLKSALEDHELPTSGSKQDRIDRLIQHFVPVTRIVDTMHIHDARELARSLGLSVTAAKEELVNRIVEHFAADRDLANQDEGKDEVPAESKALAPGGFAALFGGLKGHQLQQLLLAFQLRHSGSKQTRISALWNSPYSEHTLLGKLKNPDLDGLLLESDLICRGSKSDKIEILLKAFSSVDGATAPDSQGEDSEKDSVPDESTDPGRVEAEPEQASIEGRGLVAEINALLASIELTSKSPNRFDGVREHLAERFGIDPSSVAIKWLGDPKNHRNRIGEALRASPTLLLLLAPREEGDSVLEAVRSRMALSAHTHFVTLLKMEDRPAWISGTIMCAIKTAFVEELGRALPDGEIQLVGFPREIEHEHILDLAKRAQRELAEEWTKDDLPPESRVRRGLRRAFDRADIIVRTKHISDVRNIGNRISEAVGAGCNAVVLIVAQEVADATRSEIRRQLGNVGEPALAVLIVEAENGYAEPEIIIDGSGG